MKILGISCFFHDAAAALVVDGQLVAAAEEERFTRRKHDDNFPTNAIQFCLDQGRIEARDLDYVVFYEKPFVKLERILMSSLQMFPWSWKVFREAMATWLGDKLWIKTSIQNRIGVEANKILFSAHHLSHAASAFFCSPFEEAAILTIDGVGEWTTASMGVGRHRDITLNKELRFPHSLGLLYSAFTAFLGFEVNEGEYKVMGMAPYGRPRYVEEIQKLIHVCSDGSFWLDMDYFCFHYSTERTYSPKFERLFGRPRDPRTPFFTLATGYPAYFGERPAHWEALGRENQRYADLAASIQVVTEDVVLTMARALHKETGLRKLCLAGGVALNSVANGRILRETPFEDLYVQPSAGDGGGAVGAALYVAHTVLGQPRRFVMEHAYWGKAYSSEAIRKFLIEGGIAHEMIEDEDKLLNRAAQMLLAGKVIGWFQGAFEWGPRALGDRSILADPRRADMKDIVNLKIKFREPYRPFAPSVLAERAEEYFDLKDPTRHYPARFMSLVVDVKENRKDRVPAITHVDGTARLQVVTKDTNPLYYALIDRFGQATGVPMILNTSYNLRGEPIVNTPREAFATFSRSGLDGLVMDRFLIQKEA
jgi:carbamoyltransferase